MMQAPDPDIPALDTVSESNDRACASVRPDDPTSREDGEQRWTAAERGDHRVILIGASIRAAAQSAKRGGWSVIGIDRFGDRDTRAACDRFFLWQRSPQDGQEPLPIELCRRLPIVRGGGWTPRADSSHATVHPIEAIASRFHDCDCKDPARLQAIAAAAGVHFPPVTPVRQATESSRPFQQASASPVQPRSARHWLQKDATSCGGLGVRWESPSAKVASIAPPISISKTTYRQAFVHGRTFGATIFHTASQTKVLGVCRSLTQRVGDLPFVYVGSVGPIDLSPENAQQLIRIAKAYGHPDRFPLLNLDYIVDARQQLWLLEINHRWSASMELIDRAYDWPAGGSLFDAAMRREVQLPEKINRRFVKRVVLARRRLRFDADSIASWLAANESIHDLPAAETLIEQGEPVCTLLCRLEDDASFNARRYRRVINRIAVGGTAPDRT